MQPKEYGISVVQRWAPKICIYGVCSQASAQEVGARMGKDMEWNWIGKVSQFI